MHLVTCNKFGIEISEILFYIFANVYTTAAVLSNINLKEKTYKVFAHSRREIKLIHSNLILKT